jgi:predicted AAA+ superfamily ATPase
MRLQFRSGASILQQRMQYQSQVPRFEMVRRVREALAESPVTALLGPRQCGKTWLARQFVPRPENYFDLHDFVDRARLEESYFKVLDGLEGTVVIDEAQARPDLFQKLRVLADRPMSPARFLITGSASPGIIKGVSESLAGRIRLLPLGGFTAQEVGWENWQKLWLRGGFPRAYLSEIEENSLKWRQDYISMFINRDLRRLADTKMSEDSLAKLLRLLAHCHGQNWNHSEAASTLGVSYKTVQRHIEIMLGAFVVRELPPFFANVGKRLRKAPKVYLRDTGLLHALLMLRDSAQLPSHPRYGASWEGFCIEQIVRTTNTQDDECFTWSVQGGEEIDLVVQKPGGVFGFEFKTADAPQKTRSLMNSLASLNLTRVFIIYPGEKDYSLDDRVEAVAFRNLGKILNLIS